MSPFIVGITTTSAEAELVAAALAHKPRKYYGYLIRVLH